MDSRQGSLFVDWEFSDNSSEINNNDEAQEVVSASSSSTSTGTSSASASSASAGCASTGSGLGAGVNNLVDDRADEDPFAPLAARLRPRNLQEYIGQSHLLGPGKPLRQALERGQCYSMILWGPPGVGKTTLAFIIAKSTNAKLEQISAVASGIKDIREAIERAKERRRHNVRTILFVDEVHRFNKAQQDAFLPYIENGTVIFIGATTENPSFQVNSALLSRARVYVLKKLNNEELDQLIDCALTSPRGLASLNLTFDDRVRAALKELSDGDARHLLTTLEMLSDDAAPMKDGSKVITFAKIGRAHV